MLFLGCTDTTTARYISDRTGEVTVAVASKTKNLNSWRVSDYTTEFREAKSIGKRKLLTPDEVLRLPIKEALIMMRGQKILKVKKFDYTLHPYSKKLIRKKASTHVPEWQKEKETKVPSVSASPETPIVEMQEELPARITLNVSKPEVKKERPKPEKLDAFSDIKPEKDKGGDDNASKPKYSKVNKNILKIK